MSFLIQRPAGRGLSLTQIDAPVLRIGRGTNQELRSENPAVALEHAVIESDAAGYLITDKGSITGTYVNRKPVETSRLTKGDVIEIGDLRIEVQLADPAKPLFLRVATARAPVSATFDDDEDEVVAAAPATPGKRVVKPKKIDYVAAYRLRRPYLTKLSLTALLLIIALAIVGEVILPERQKTFMPGGVSAAHSRARDASGNVIAHRCDACHTPWNSVTNGKCLDCHPHEPHARFEAKTPDCFSCHAEHRGALKLSAIDDRFCAGCHSDLRAHVKANDIQLARIARIPSFGDTHPDFLWPPDNNPLRFNHKLHLAPRGVFNEKGRREILECAACHALRENDEPAQIDYEAHCQRCHRLTFNPRFPTAEVPHGGDPKNVYGYVAITYSGNRDLIGKPPDVVRRMLASRKGVAVDTRAQIDADQVLKTKCQKCHDVVRRGEQLAVTPPVFPARWLSGARFTHAVSQHRACETCHVAARESVPTSDVLLPRRADCTGCHAADAKKGQAASKCVTCHEYHHRPKRQLVAASLAPVAGMGGLGSGGRMLQWILLALIVILLLVVLVPVGIALFQRLRPERASVPQRSTPPKAPPPPVMQDIPTAKVMPPPEIAAARVPAPPPIDATRVPDVPNDEVRGTEMVQWYGMLHCTSGPLEGQRFVIEEDGFYIGRDAALAKIVIPDSRVSKRHVRIVPRDGKVWAVDQGSTNGTFLAGGGQRITEVQLKRGDTLILGDNAATFVYQI
ncbi:MAG TPA: FHA domain-containing protein [Thermoanaerobaculia bacterium]|nr:FHA domain-containing protein [Thermoanaerobaculia bacterium]